MTRDFKTRAELYAYTERRVLVDVDYYARAFMNMGDIFPPDPYGIYNASTGECIADFGKAPYSLENGKKHRLTDWNDFDNSKGDIYDHHNHLTLSARNHKRVTVVEDRPVFFKAKEAAAAYFAQVFKDNEDYVILAKNIKEFRDCVYMDAIEESPRRFSELKRVEDQIFKDNHKSFEGDAFKEKLFHHKSGIFMVDVMLDIRLKDYYERQFEELDRQRDKEQDQYHDGRYIRCS